MALCVGVEQSEQAIIGGDANLSFLGQGNTATKTQLVYTKVREKRPLALVTTAAIPSPLITMIWLVIPKVSLCTHLLQLGECNSQFFNIIELNTPKS